jgi:predicted RNase H-like HicB family nuclease
MSEIMFEVVEDEIDGGYSASALGPGYGIHTQGEDWADLKEMVRDAVLCHFGDEGQHKVVTLRFGKNETIVA